MKFRISTNTFPRVSFSMTVAALCLLLIAGWAMHARAQQSGNQTSPQQDKDTERLLKAVRERGLVILKNIKQDLKDYYYDPNFRGIDLEARFKTAQEKIKTAPSDGHVYSIIAQVLADFNDSHTFFLPPDRVLRVDYGWRMQMIGDKCFVITVKKGSDAESKGLKVGDQIYSIDGYEPTRENLWKIEYSYYILKPRGGMRLVVEEPNGLLRRVDLAVKLTLYGREVTPEGEKKETDEEFKEKQRERERERKERERKEKEEGEEKQRERERIARGLPRFHELSKEIIVCRMPGFDVREKEMDEMMKRIAPYQALILDLRGNSGGYVRTLQRLVGYFFEQDIKISERKGRKETKPMMAKTRKERVFKGRLVVLVDSDSASAAEIFARLMQLEKRGVVIGDRSSGKVMQSVKHPHLLDDNLFSRGVMYGYYIISSRNIYGASITNADVIMSDGKSLENVGVMPDELLLPTGADLAARRDPVMARAAAVFGFELDAKKAGAIFPDPRSTEVSTEDETEEEGEN